MPDTLRHCTVCGRGFVPQRNRVLCGDACRRISNLQAMRRFREAEKDKRRAADPERWARLDGAKQERAAAKQAGRKPDIIRPKRVRDYACGPNWLLHTGALGIVRDVCRRTGDAAVLVLKSDLEDRKCLPWPGELMIDHGVVCGHAALTVRVDNWTQHPDLKSRIVRVARLETGLSCGGEVKWFFKEIDKIGLLCDIRETFYAPDWRTLYGID